MDRKTIGWTEAASLGLAATGMWPKAVRAGNQIFLQGQTAIAMEGNLVGVGDPGAQARNACANIKALLEELGGQMSDVVKITVYVTDVAFRPAIYAEIVEAFDGKCPCSTGVVVKGLALPELLVEIDATAIVSEGED